MTPAAASSAASAPVWCISVTMSHPPMNLPFRARLIWLPLLPISRARLDLPAALGEACSGVQAVLRRTAEAGADELLLVESQDLLAGSLVGLVPERVF